MTIAGEKHASTKSKDNTADTIAPGQWLADAILSYASFDFCFGEVDR